MKLYAIVILSACCLLAAQAAPEKKMMGQKSRQVEQDAKVGVASAAGASSASTAAKDPSSGRLFLKKFLTFKNLFSSSNQPVIPIIITGAGTSTSASPTSPTVTVTSTGTVPSATGTITTSPTTPTSTTTATRQTVVKGARYGSDDDQENDQEKDQDQGEEQEQELAQVQMPAQAYPAELMDEQALQAALAAGAQEYEVVTTGHELQGTGEASGEGAKATQNSNHISLRRKGARRGQVISVRIPPRYRRYFKNGQKVMLNTGSRPATKRRVVRKRVPAKRVNKNNNRRRNGNKKNRRNRNKNRRNRITPV